MMMIHSFSKSKLKTFNSTTHQKIKTRNKSSLPLHISSSSFKVFNHHFKLSPLQQQSRLTPHNHIISNSHNHHFKLSPLQQQSRLTPHNHIISNSHKQEEEGKEEGKEGKEGKEEEENVRLRFIRGKKLLSELSTLGIGGPCNYFLQVFNQTQFRSAIRYCHEHSIRFIIIGKGSNCLFDDLGFNGCVILNRIEFVEVIEPGIYRVGSGYPFNRLGSQCSNEGFTGLEFASGIPGTVGGATFMNAGANGQETSDAIYCVEIVTTDGRHETLNRKDITFRYRSSSLQHMEDMAGIIAVTFKLSPSVSAKKTQQTYLTRRRLTQPLGERSAGSVFKNPPPELGVSAGELIEQARLKGCRVGGAMVSDIHANFFINCGNSTSKDMLELINIVKEKVDQKFGIKLKEEIQYIYPHQNI